MKKIKKLLSLFVTLTVILGILVSCSKDGEVKKGDAVSFSVTTVNFGRPVEGTPIQEKWLEIMTEHMGMELDIKWEWIPTGDYKQKFQVINAGGNLPDLISTFDTPKADVDRYGADGMYVDIADYLDIAPNYKAALDGSPEGQRQSCYTSEGNLWGFFNGTYSSQDYYRSYNYGQTFYKNSVLKEHGLEIPKTLEEMYEVAKALKAAGASEYPIVLHEEWQSPEDTVFFAYHTNNGDTQVFDGEKFSYGPLSDDYKEALVYLNKIYSEGLISPDYFTHTVDNGNSAISGGSGLIVPNGWEGYAARWNVADPTAEWVGTPLVPSEKYADTPWHFTRFTEEGWGLTSGYSVLISAESENIEELVKFMDYQYSEEVTNLMNWGIEDLTYEIKDGEIARLLNNVDEIDALIATGLPLSASARAGIFPQVQYTDAWSVVGGIQFPFFYNGEFINQTAIDFASENITDANTAPIPPPYSLTADENEEYSLIMTPVKTFAKEQKAKFIKGDRSFDEWDAYIGELNAMGDIQRAMDIHNAYVK